MAFLILDVHVIAHTIPICGADEQGGDLLAFLYREADNVTLDLLTLGGKAFIDPTIYQVFLLY